MTVYQKHLLKRLPSRVYGFNFDNQMGRSELLVPVNEYLGPKHKVQVLNMNCLDVWDKHFTICNKKTYIYIYIYAYNEVRYGVSVQINKTTISRKTVKLEISMNPLHAMRGGREFLRQTNCRTPG